MLNEQKANNKDHDTADVTGRATTPNEGDEDRETGPLWSARLTEDENGWVRPPSLPRYVFYFILFFVPFTY